MVIQIAEQCSANWAENTNLWVHASRPVRLVLNGSFGANPATMAAAGPFGGIFARHSHILHASNRTEIPRMSPASPFNSRKTLSTSAGDYAYFDLNALVEQDRKSVV